MNRGIVGKAFREAFLTTALCGLGLFLFEALIAWVFWTYQELVSEEILQIEAVRKFVMSMIGADTPQIGPGALRSLAWVHPVALSLLWAHNLIICTRMPAGEIDRGTVDILFTLPVSRARIFGSETFVWMATGALIIGMAVLGNLFGHQFVPEEGRPDLGQLGVIALNLYSLHLAVGAMTWLFAAMADRRGRAVGTAFAVVLFLFLWNFLTEYWSFAKDVAFLNILSYFKPLTILEEHTFPSRDILVLLAVAVPLWIAAAVTLGRRDICTV